MLPTWHILFSPMLVHGGSIMATGEVLMRVGKTLLPFWLEVFLFLFAWSLVGHSQRHGPPEVVIPLKVTTTGVGMKAGDWLSYSMHFGGQRHIVHMKVNKYLLSRHLPVFTYTDQGALITEQPFVPNDCYYHGFVKGDPESLVALSSCLGGFQGILQTNDTVYEIEPKNHSTTFEHLIYKVDSKETSLRCGLTDEEIEQGLKFQKAVNLTLMQSGYEGWWTHKRFLELAVVVDHNRYLHRESNTTKVWHEVCLIINEIDNFLNSLDVHVVLTGIEVWTERNLLPVKSIDSLLNEFCKWKRSSFNVRLPHDIAHIFVKKFYGVTVGLAYVGGVCYPRYNCGVDSFTHDNFYKLAYIVSHEIGHNLGMPHDGSNCKCGHRVCIMFPMQVDASRFSNCSYATFMDNIASQNCLYISSNMGNIFTFTRCGNRVVENGEECDCGTLDLCRQDPCCQTNCTLRPGATCAFGLCCQRCQIAPSGTVCRQKENVCDLPEWCNGTSHHCPEDVYLQNGIPCKNSGYCYEKSCKSRELQCREIFGKEAKSANESCYTKLNTQGDRFGNCGIRNARYERCNLTNVLCGRLQCENVTEIPLLSDHSSVHWIRVNGITCWGTDYHLGMSGPDIGDVKDGTECDAQYICIKRQCVRMPILLPKCSPQSCNMRGVCNNRNNCHCNREWDPPNCQVIGHGGSVDSGPPPRRDIGHPEKEEEDHITFVILVWFFLPVLLLLLLLLLVLYFMLKNQVLKGHNVPTSP